MSVIFLFIFNCRIIRVAYLQWGVFTTFPNLTRRVLEIVGARSKQVHSGIFFKRSKYLLHFCFKLTRETFLHNAVYFKRNYFVLAETCWFSLYRKCVKIVFEK
jgi:hypothetical protein